MASDSPTVTPTRPRHDDTREGEGKPVVAERETVTRDTDLRDPKNSAIAAQRDMAASLTVETLPRMTLSDGASSSGAAEKSRETAEEKKPGTNESPDGAQITRDDQGRVTGITYKDGTTREFGYDRNTGRVSSYTENGQKFTVETLNGHLKDEFGRDTGLKNPMVSQDGKYSFSDLKGTFTTVNTDRSREISNRDGSLVYKDGDNRTTKIQYPDGKERKFGYDDKGNLNSITDKNGKEYTFTGTHAFGIAIGSFEAKDGSKMSHVQLAKDGTMTYQDKAGKIHSDFTSGRSAVTTRTAEELRERARAIREASGPLSDGSGIKKQLEGLTHADRAALDEQYRGQYGDTLTNTLRDQAGNPNKAKNVNEALRSMTESQLRMEVEKQFSNPVDRAAASKKVDEFEQRSRRQHVPADQVADAHLKAIAALKDPGDKRGFPKDRTQEMDRALTDTTPTIASLNEKYGVKFDVEKNKDGTTTRLYYVEGADGEKKPVLDSKSDKPEEIEKQLREFRDKKVAELESKYNLQFTKDGTLDSEKGVNMRAPRLDEALALEEGFKRSESSTSTLNGRPILVQFAEKPTSPYDAYVQKRPDGQDRILFEPLDRKYGGLRDTIIHEWTHNAQHNLEKRAPAELQKVYEDMGYRKVKTEAGFDQWQMRDKDGNYWAQQRNQFPYGSWNRVDEKGRPLKADGTPAKDFNDKDAQTRKNYEMKDKAEVKPKTDYFSYPWENGAEAQMFFRTNEKKRAELYMNDPKGYEAAKKFDQLDLDNDPKFGKNADGSSKFIRLPNGEVGLNNPTNQKAVADYEAELKQRRDTPPAGMTSGASGASSMDSLHRTIGPCNCGQTH